MKQLIRIFVFLRRKDIAYLKIQIIHFLYFLNKAIYIIIIIEIHYYIRNIGGLSRDMNKRLATILIF